MITAEQLLTTYQRLAELTAQMATAAAADDWKRVAKLEFDCASHARILKDNEGTTWSAPTRACKAELFRRILDNDRHVRDLASPWIARLPALIGNIQTQSCLAKASHPA